MRPLVQVQVGPPTNPLQAGGFLLFGGKRKDRCVLPRAHQRPRTSLRGGRQRPRPARQKPTDGLPWPGTIRPAIRAEPLRRNKVAIVGGVSSGAVSDTGETLRCRIRVDRWLEIREV